MQATVAETTQSNPFLDRGLKRHHDRYLGLALDARGWRRAFWLMTFAALISNGALAYIASRAQIEVVIATVDENHRMRSAPTATQAFQADPGLLQSITQVTVHEWVVNARTITADPLAQERLLASVWNFAAADTRTFLHDFLEQRKPEYSSGNRVTVEIESLQLRSDKYWEVEWRETRWAPDGRLASTERWEGRLRTELVPPSSIEVAELNPAGIYITGLSWARRAL
jgi:type IV secretory pathway TrbF-like protein